MPHNIDTFSTAELYLMANAFGGEVLFGLPDKKLYQLKGEAVFAEAQQRLIEKEIVTSEGKLTDGGAYVIRALEVYHQSKKFVRINNLMFAFQERVSDNLIMLIELEEGQTYRLHVISKSIALRLLAEWFPFILRDSPGKATTFLRKELTEKERQVLEQFKPKEPIFNFESFQTEEDLLTHKTMTKHIQWLVFLQDDQLVMVHLHENKYYYVSPYWFLHQLFEALEFSHVESMES